jgi:hypothetical protein
MKSVVTIVEALNISRWGFLGKLRQEELAG